MDESISESDQMNSNNEIYSINKLKSEKEQIEKEIQYMKQVQQTYKNNSIFVDTAIAFYRKIEALKQTKNELVGKLNDMSDLHRRLHLRIAEIERNVQMKDIQEDKLLKLLQDVYQLKKDAGILKESAYPSSEMPDSQKGAQEVDIDQ